MSYVFLDTETSGLNSSRDRVIQLSYIITNDKYEIIEGKNFYLNIDEYIPQEATMVHGIDNEKLKELSGGKTFKDYAKEILWDFQNSKVICHNVEFDIAFLENEFFRIDKSIKINKTFCTMRNYTNICRIGFDDYYNSYKWPKLSEVVEYLNINSEELKAGASNVFGCTGDFHDARMDVYTTYQIYKKIKDATLEDVRKTLLDKFKYLDNKYSSLTVADSMINSLNLLKDILNEVEYFEGYIERRFEPSFEAIDKEDIPF